MQSTTHTYEVRPRKDKRGVDLISDALPFGGLRYGAAKRARERNCDALRLVAYLDPAQFLARLYIDNGDIIDSTCRCKG